MTRIELQRESPDGSYVGVCLPLGDTQEFARWFVLARLEATGIEIAWGVIAKPRGYDEAVERLRHVLGSR